MVQPMLRLIGVALVCVPVWFSGLRATAAEPSHNQLTAAELADGWILLFDGKTTYGWKANSQADWTVADGVIRVTTGEPGLLNTTTQFADYALKVDFRSDLKTNSGVFLRTVAKPTDPAVDCYELNIAPQENPFPTGSFVKRKKAVAVKETTDWQSFDVTAQGAHFVARLNGEVVLDYTDPKPIPRGFIGLQLNMGRAEFRNIKLKPLGVKSMFNGKDLTGWKSDQTGQSTFSVTPEGAIRVKNGKGQLESTGTYADFVLQLEAFCNGKELNSGIFFRSIPGEAMNGYESQINNGFKDGDRAVPKDCGTGGIFRRQNARFVIPNDFEWFHKTIIAEGSHMAVWVNGIQVSDFTDDRPPHANPRQGLRTEAGTIIIQGHDPTTDLSFRNLRIVELPKP